MREHASCPNGLLGLAVLLMAAILCLQAAPAGAAITLAEFTAIAQLDGSIVVRWVTASEMNSSQFILYRSESPDGPWDNQVDRQDAKDLSGIVGATYVYTDTKVTLNTTYYYVLGEVEKSGDLIMYLEARDSATAGQVPTATFTPTRTATRTATPLRTPTGTPTTTQEAPEGQTNTATATRTATPSRTPTGTSPATQAAAERPTATRRFTNTPRPAASLLPGLAADATASPTRLLAATPMLGATVSAPASTPDQGATLAAFSSTASPVAAIASPLTATPTRGAPDPADGQSLQATAEATATPRIFGPAATDRSLLAATARPQGPSASAPANQTARSSRSILLLGGIAVGLAALLGGITFAIWRQRQH